MLGDIGNQREYQFSRIMDNGTRLQRGTFVLKSFSSVSCSFCFAASAASVVKYRAKPNLQPDRISKRSERVYAKTCIDTLSILCHVLLHPSLPFSL